MELFMSSCKVLYQGWLYIKNIHFNETLEYLDVERVVSNRGMRDGRHILEWTNPTVRHEAKHWRIHFLIFDIKHG